MDIDLPSLLSYLKLKHSLTSLPASRYRKKYRFSPIAIRINNYEIIHLYFNPIGFSADILILFQKSKAKCYGFIAHIYTAKT
jgi:hypothetical protein